jgi:ribosomal-protein-alanine N-acetyltransferase
LRFRQAFAADSPVLSKIHEECFPNYWDSNAFTNFFGIENTRAVLVELHDGKKPQPVGMMVYRVVHEQSDIITIAIRPNWRRQGLARELLSRAFSHARALGAKAMFLDVEEGNQAAMVLYDRLGFKQINRRKGYYKQKDGSYTDALVMTCALGSLS